MITLKILNLAREKSFAFSKLIVEQYLAMHAGREFVLSRYFVRGGTLIGAHLEEAVAAHTRNEYFGRINAAYKEAKKTHYWIRLMAATKMLESSEADQLLKDTDELLLLINNILKALKAEDVNKPIASSDSLKFEWG